MLKIQFQMEFTKVPMNSTYFCSGQSFYMMVQINSDTAEFSFWTRTSFFRLDLSSLELSWKWTLLEEFKQDFDMKICLQYSILVLGIS